MPEITPRERFINALERRAPLPGRAPHFELVFFLTMEALGKVHPSHRQYSQWDQMEERERQLHRLDMAEAFILPAQKYGQDATPMPCTCSTRRPPSISPSSSAATASGFA